MMAAIDDDGTQDRVAVYDGGGMTVARDTGDCGLAMIAVMVEDGGSRQ
jgi:hypothetical protein